MLIKYSRDAGWTYHSNIPSIHFLTNFTYRFLLTSHSHLTPIPSTQFLLTSHSHLTPIYSILTHISLPSITSILLPSYSHLTHILLISISHLTHLLLTSHFPSYSHLTTILLHIRTPILLISYLYCTPFFLISYLILISYSHFTLLLISNPTLLPPNFTPT